MMREVPLATNEGLALRPAAALIWLCSVAPLAAILMPLLIPVLQSAHSLDAAQLGLLASADLAGTCMATVTAPLWLGRTGSRGGALAGLATLIVANGVGAFAATPTSLLVTRLIAGIGSGLTLSSAIPVVAKSANPARLVSAIQVLQLLLAASALLGAGWLLSFGDVKLVLLAVVAISVASMPLALLLPKRVAGTDHKAPGLRDLAPSAPILIGILVYFASVAVLTNYGGKLGAQHRLAIGTIGSALAIANLGALPGSLIAMLAGRSVRLRSLLVAVSLFECLAVGLALWTFDALPFGAAFFAIQMCITIVAPLQVAILVQEDRGGRAIEGLAAMQSTGQAIGPLLGASAISGADVQGAYVFGAACVLIAAGLLVVRRRGAGVTGEPAGQAG